MTSGKTDWMIAFHRSLRWSPTPERPARERDRTLRGKDRIRARKAARRAA